MATGAEKAKSEQSFEENFKILESLAVALQDNKISIDELIPRMKQALDAVKVCKDVLKETKHHLKEISKELESGE